MAYVTEEDLASWSIPIANSEYELVLVRFEQHFS